MEKITLNNGIVVEVEDKTVVLSGDLYMIHQEFTTVVKLSEKDSDLKRYCGGDLLRKTRVFKKSAVHERNLEEAKVAMKDSYLASTIPYLEHPKFVSCFKKRCLEEFREQEEKARLRMSGHEERE